MAINDHILEAFFFYTNNLAWSDPFPMLTSLDY